MSLGNWTSGIKECAVEITAEGACCLAAACISFRKLPLSWQDAPYYKTLVPFSPVLYETLLPKDHLGHFLCSSNSARSSFSFTTSASPSPVGVRVSKEDTLDLYFIASVSPGVSVPFFTYPKSILSGDMSWL